MADEENVNMDTVPVEEPAGETTIDAKVAGTSTTVAGVTMDETQFPLAIILISSIILLIATTAAPGYTDLNSPYKNYTISISSISLIISFICLVLHKFAGDLYGKIEKNICALTFFWAFIGACFLTFKGPFTTTSNGYFSAWSTVYGCAMSMGMNTNTFKNNVRGLGAIMGHFAASIVLLIACIPEVHTLARGSKMRNHAIYALSLACLSTLVMLVLMSMDRKGKQLEGMANLGLMTFLALCWLIAACFVTFGGPFEETGNGYFSAWVGTITASQAAWAAYKAK